MVVDRDLRIVQINENFLHLLNIKRELILGNSINNLLELFLKIPEIIPNIQNALNGKASITETNFKNESEELYFKINLIPTTLDNGEPGVGLIFKDITKKKIAEIKLQQTIHEYNTTLNSISEMVSILDNDFNIIKINQALLDFLQINPKIIIGKKCYEIIHGTNKPDPKCSCSQIGNGKKIINKEFFEPHLGEKIKVTISPIIDEDGINSGFVNVLKIINRKNR
jgi:PAS domain S-box-containing protein